VAVIDQFAELTERPAAQRAHPALPSDLRGADEMAGLAVLYEPHPLAVRGDTRGKPGECRLPLGRPFRLDHC
jgi:hypothetical protein